MKIIDFEKKGNLVRFYLGENKGEYGWTNENYVDSKGKKPDWLAPSDKYYGDDWNDAPYDCNAGPVYSQFIKGHKDVAFNFDDLVLEPADVNSFDKVPYTKDDMKDRKVPCIIVVPKEIVKDSYYETFDYWVGAEGIKKYYFGDELD